jgi:uncharacterized protein YlxW (UPF0749 family)
VALGDVCTTYRDQVRGVEQEMYLYMKENPTTEEARQKVPELAQALQVDLEKAIAQLHKKAIDDKKKIDEVNKEAEVAGNVEVAGKKE